MDNIVTQKTNKSECLNKNVHLDPFLILAKSAKGAALKSLIEQVLEAPGVYVFGELLELQCIQQLVNSEHNKHLKLLELFTYGTFQDYVNQAYGLPPLTPLMKKKLHQLTVVALSAKSKYVSYESLMKELHLNNIRDLEDLLISAIYANIIQGRLDQQNSRLEVEWAMGRDVRTEDMDSIINTLNNWCSSCETILGSIETQTASANAFLSEDAIRRAKIDTEVENIMSTIKKTSSHEMDLATSDTRLSSSHPAPSSGIEVKPKKSKVKGLRGSGMKLWSSKNTS
uniref:COP9 signalosome complex subunit 7a-like n=1 Tax=Ciona intestinalis TaxID=7719 RepID=F6Z0V4_CIOIN|nr:COP9 signalosome complex subunit 7a-like [Ciona intestinalis]|eukprot:XP_026691136.1 COP9 signalosome complex subunit 7a-like [Ciona intestinalis]